MNKNVEPDILINISSLDISNKKVMVKLREYLRTIEGDNTIGFHIRESSKVVKLNLKVDQDRLEKRKIQDLIKSIVVEQKRIAEEEEERKAKKAYEAELARIAEEERIAQEKAEEERLRLEEEERLRLEEEERLRLEEEHISTAKESKIIKENRKKGLERNKNIEFKKREQQKINEQNLKSMIEPVLIDLKDRCKYCQNINETSSYVGKDQFFFEYICFKCGSKNSIAELKVITEYEKIVKAKEKADRVISEKIKLEQEKEIQFQNKKETNRINKIAEHKKEIEYLIKDIENRKNSIDKNIKVKNKEKEVSFKKNKKSLEIKLTKNISQLFLEEKTLQEKFDSKFAEVNQELILERKSLDEIKNNLLNTNKSIDSIKNNYKIFKTIRKYIQKKKMIKLKKQKFYLLSNETKAIQNIEIALKNITNLKQLYKEEHRILQHKNELEQKHLKKELQKELQIIEKKYVNEVKNIPEVERLLASDYVTKTESEIQILKNKIAELESQKLTDISNLKNALSNETEKLLHNLTESEKRYLENQLNGITPIKELNYEDSIMRLIKFRHLNETGVWHSTKGNSFVTFQKTDHYWENFTGRSINKGNGNSYFDGTRGIDDWASK